MYALSCGHEYHLECLLEVRKKECALCSKEYNDYDQAELTILAHRDAPPSERAAGAAGAEEDAGAAVENDAAEAGAAESEQDDDAYTLRDWLLMSVSQREQCDCHIFSLALIEGAEVAVRVDDPETFWTVRCAATGRRLACECELCLDETAENECACGKTVHIDEDYHVGVSNGQFYCGECSETEDDEEGEDGGSSETSEDHGESE